MLRLTKKAGYGLMAVQYLAEHADDASLRARDIAEACHVPLATTGQEPAAAGEGGDTVLARRNGRRVFIAETTAADFDVRSNLCHRRVAVHSIQRGESDEFRSAPELHDQATAGAGEQQYLWSLAQHLHLRPGETAGRRATPSIWPKFGNDLDVAS